MVVSGNYENFIFIKTILASDEIYVIEVGTDLGAMLEMKTVS